MESFRIPGTTGPEIVVRRSAIGTLSVLADGHPVKRKRGRKLLYDIPMPDGTTHEILITGQYTGLRAVVDGAAIALERKLRPWEVVLVFLPLALVILGGAIGAIIGAIGAAVNSQLVRTSARTPIRTLGMLGVAGLSGLVWFGIAFALAPTPEFSTGTCLNGIHEGATVTISSSHSVDCASPHDNEVIGTFDYTPADQFPGGDALQAYAATVCIPAFKTYVGVDLTASRLDIIPVVPTSETWLKGDRQIACVVLTSDGSQLTKSVKGAAL